MPLQPGTRLGPYEILAQLGEGGMGEVYCATDTKLARTVALKVLSPALAADPDYMARFTREAHILASFHHPNIAVIHGLEESGGVRALVMELVEGRNLADYIASGSYEMEEALRIAKQVAEALEAAHEKGVVHRDLKPANVMLTPDGVAKVLDFGLAKQAESRAPSGDPALSLTVRATQAGVVMGTAGYMSPEQAAAKPTDRRADIWAFGVLLWEMLCRKPLFSGETIAHTLADVLRAEIDLNKLPAETPAAIRELIRRCLDRDVKKRLQAIGEARIAIEKYLADPNPTMPAPLPLRAKSNRLPWAVAAVTALAGLGIATMHWREAPPERQVLRFTISEPPKSIVHTFALSPNGRHVAVAADQDGKRKLWVRALDRFSYQELGGTEGASYPFWSPDSRTIGFFASGNLKKIALDGGPAVVLCDAPDGRGGTWNRNGDIVFAPTGVGGLQRVAASGGVPVAVTQPQKPVTHRFPAFLPDGRRFLYLQTLGDAGKEGIYAGSLDGAQPSRVLPDLSNAFYVPPQGGAAHGHLVLQRQRKLMALPVEESSLRAVGELFPIEDEVGVINRNYALMSVSGNGALLYWDGETPNAQLTWMDRAGQVLGVVGEPSNILGFALSPDGKTVAANRRTGGRSIGDVWLHDVERGVETRLTFDGGGYATWTPDGRHLAYYNSSELRLTSTDGRGATTVLVPGVGSFAAPNDFSRDGKYMLYTDGSTGGSDLKVKPMEGDGKPIVFLASPFMETDGAFSPDGKWVAYVSNESGTPEIYVRPFPSAAGKWKVSERGGVGPRWSPDGKELFYIAPDMNLMAASVNAAGSAFAVSRTQVLFASRMQLRSFGTSQLIRRYVVAPDGKRFMVARRMNDESGTPIRVVVNWLDGVKH